MCCFGHTHNDFISLIILNRTQLTVESLNKNIIIAEDMPHFHLLSRYNIDFFFEKEKNAKIGMVWNVMVRTRIACPVSRKPFNPWLTIQNGFDREGILPASHSSRMKRQLKMNLAINIHSTIFNTPDNSLLKNKRENARLLFPAKWEAIFLFNYF